MKVEYKPYNDIPEVEFLSFDEQEALKKDIEEQMRKAPKASDHPYIQKIYDTSNEELILYHRGNAFDISKLDVGEYLMVRCVGGRWNIDSIIVVPGLVMTDMVATQWDNDCERKIIPKWFYDELPSEAKTALYTDYAYDRIPDKHRQYLKRLENATTQ